MGIARRRHPNSEAGLTCRNAGKVAGVNLCLVVLPFLIAAGCHGSPTAPDAEMCGPYPDWQRSLYVLPYAPEQAFTVVQGNCSAAGNGHRGSERYGYDFGMPIGSELVAARSGIVAHVQESHSDGQVAATGLDNYIVIAHDDGTHALYGHLTRDGALVDEGASVRAGEAIGRSGNTGNTNNIPHLHLSVHGCNPVRLGSSACPSQPVTFRNTSPNPTGLQQGQRYQALP